MRKAGLSILLIAVIAVVAFYVMRAHPPESPPEQPTMIPTPVVEPTVVLEPEPQPADVAQVVEPEKVEQPSEPPVEEGASISGRVTDSNMYPVEGAEVNAEPDPFSGLPGFGPSQSARLSPHKPMRSAVTDAKGEYKLTGATAGRGYVVFVKATGYARISQQVIVPAEGDLPDVDFTLGQGAIISGHVVDTNRNRIARASVQAQLRDDPERTSGAFALVGSYGFGFYSFQADTNDEGEFEIVDLAPGTYSFSVRMPSGNGWRSLTPQNEPVTVKAGDMIPNLELVVEPGDKGTIEGYARDDEGNAVPGVSVTGWRGSGMWNAKTDASGHYHLEGFIDGPVSVRFVHQGCADALLENVAVGTLDANVVMVQRGGVSGTVLDAATRRPVGGCEITVVRMVNREGGDAVMKRWRSSSNPETGEFVIEDMNPGVATFAVTAEGYVPQEIPDILIEPGKITANVRIYLVRSAVIEGYITHNGVAVSRNATVHAYPASRAMEVRVSEVDATGYYCIEDLLEDTYTVVASRESSRTIVPSGGRVTQTASVRAAPGYSVRLDFHFRGGSTIQGAVSWPQGYSLVGVIVRHSTATEPLSYENWKLQERQFVAVCLCRGDGTFSVADLPAGMYNVTAACINNFDTAEMDIRQSSQTVTIGEGESLALNFAL